MRELCYECGLVVETTCRTCRHWQPAIKSLAHMPLFGLCKRLSARDPDTVAPDTKLLAVDDDQNFATEVSTKPDFGCLHWEGD